VLENSNTSISHKLLTICPTRWTVRAKAFQRFLENYEAIISTINELLSDSNSVRPETRSRLRGYVKYLQKFDTLFALILCIRIFTPCELFAKTLQGPTMTITETHRLAEILIQTLQGHRDTFDRVYEEARQMAQTLKLEFSEPKIARIVQPPRRYEYISNSSPCVSLDVQEKLRKAFYEAFDLLLNEIRRRFEQPGKCTI
jgi:hypothetical protein